MFKFKVFLPILLALIGLKSFSAVHELEEAAPFPSPLTLRPSPADAIQLLGAQELVVEGDGAECFLSKVSLVPYLPKVRQQGNLGACTAFALTAATYARSAITGASVFDASPLFVYHGERKLEGSIDVDRGASLYSGLQTLKTVGFCPETVWTYDAGPHKFKQTPSKEAYEAAKSHKILGDMGILWIGPDLEKMRAALANEFVVPFGVQLHPGFHKAESNGGLVPMRGELERAAGGHAMVFVGYDDTFKNLDGSLGALTFQNSWGEGWGDKGFGHLPYGMVKYVSEAWGIRRISGAPEAAEMPNHISFKASEYQIPQPEEDALSDA
jgi:C1A family cysteine protease